MAERRLIDQAPCSDEPALTTHLRRVAAPPPLSPAAQAKILARLQSPERPRAPARLALGFALGAVAVSLGVWFAVGPQRVAPSILVADDTATRHSDPRLPARVVVPSVAPVESAPLPPLVLTSGALVVHATAQPRLVETPFGNVRVEAHSVVRVQVHTQRVVIAAWEGSATFSDDARHVAIARGATWSSERRLPAAVSHPTNENDHDRAALTLLAQALSALRRDHDPAAALELLARYRALSPHVSLSHEADLIEAEALVAAGRDKPALRLLDRLNLDGRSDLEHARDQLRREKK